MHTICSSSCLLLWCLLGGVCPGGVCQRGMSAQGVSAQGSVCLRGVCLEGQCIPVCNGADIPHVDRMTGRCKNITFLQLRLRMVICILALQTCACDHEALMGTNPIHHRRSTWYLLSHLRKFSTAGKCNTARQSWGKTVLSHWTALYATVINSILSLYTKSSEIPLKPYITMPCC